MPSNKQRTITFRKRKPVMPRNHPAHGARLCTIAIRAGSGENFAADIWLDLTRIVPILQRALYGTGGKRGTGHAEVGSGAFVIHLRGLPGPAVEIPLDWTLGEVETHDWRGGDKF